MQNSLCGLNSMIAKPVQFFANRTYTSEYRRFAKNMNPITVVFSGPQGSGKGTQVALLKKYLSEHNGRKILHVEMGGLLRSIVQKGTYAGKKVAEVINAGEILPSFVPISIFTRELFDKFTVCPRQYNFLASYTVSYFF